jgi:hypothetical protein
VTDINTDKGEHMAKGARGNGEATNQRALKGNATRFYGDNKEKPMNEERAKACGQEKLKGK